MYNFSHFGNLNYTTIARLYTRLLTSVIFFLPRSNINMLQYIVFTFFFPQSFALEHQDTKLHIYIRIFYLENVYGFFL